MFFAIGSQKDGKCGGKIKAQDLTDFSYYHPQIAEYNDKKAKSYTQNYIASDSPDKNQGVGHDQKAMPCARCIAIPTICPAT